MIEKLLTIISGWIIALIGMTGYAGVVLLMAIESAGIPAPSEVIMPFSGYLVGQGNLNLYLAAAAGTFGNLIGSLIAYAIGYWGGRPLIERYGRYILLRHHELDLADRFFAKYGKLTVFVGRLLPIVRTYISFPAGIAKMDIKQFSLYTVLGAFPWSLGLAYIGLRLGAHWETIKHYTRGLDVVVVIAIGLVVAWWVWRKRR
ncbi:DedA family protein [Candidatus Berkelbacteria bacterium]|nr:DedA family protein [Candidatus Berkelbacteria bacterium]